MLKAVFALPILMILSGCQPTALSESPQGGYVPEATVKAGEGQFLNGFFPIGVFSQPEDSFQKWKSRGINTLLESPQGHDPAGWDRAAQAGGFYQIRRPGPDPRKDIGRKDLLAWSHWDEPDAAGRIAEWTPMFERTAREWRSIDPKRTIFINFAGPDLSWFTTRQDAYSRTYASYYPRLIATADWVANDLYPSGGWLNQSHAPRRGDITLLGEPLKILKGMTKKPLFAFIEAGDVERGNVEGARCPTVAEFRAQTWYALACGVRGIFYFPAAVGKGGFRFDSAPPEIVSAMKSQNEIIAKLEPILQSEIDPASFAPSGPASIACGWRKSGKTLLYILVNTTRNSLPGARLTFSGLAGVSSGKSLTSGASVSLSGGAWTESFEPLGVRVVQFSLP